MVFLYFLSFAYCNFARDFVPSLVEIREKGLNSTNQVGQGILYFSGDLVKYLVSES